MNRICQIGGSSGKSSKHPWECYPSSLKPSTKDENAHNLLVRAAKIYSGTVTMKFKKSSKAKAKDELNEFQAASLVGMSPTLLRWFVSYAPKHGSDRKLQARKDGERLYFERSELEGFNDWLKLAWPSKAGVRPSVPTGIRQEVREEAGGECAICQKNANSCEAAHIDPVHKSKNNHPENLIWLCANHHTKFDKNGFGPKQDSAGFVNHFKQTLTYYRRAVWELQADVTGSLFTVLKACESLNSQISAASSAEQISTVEKLAIEVLSAVPKMAPTSKQDPGYAAFKALKPKFKALVKSSTDTDHLKTTLNFAVSFKEEYLREAGFVDCPLCRGVGHYKGLDCPACGGEAELTVAEAASVDLTRYRLVTCPLCEGTQGFRGDECPACGGDGEMEQRYADQVDTRDWDEVDCPVCDGSGALRGDVCPVCGGDCRVDRQDLERIEVRDYQLVDCPLCEGRGRHQGEDCRVCRGDRQIEKRHADEVDLRNYESVSCPLCKGSGQWNDFTCRECGGEGSMDRDQVDQFDGSAYKLVKCPSCNGRQDFCRTCDGEGKVPRFVADDL